MASRNLNEFYNFVNKFLNLRNNGGNATLLLQCQDRRVTINLQLQLPSSPHTNHRSYPPPPRTCPRSRPNPSRIRRSTQSAKNQAKTDASNNVTEQVAVVAPKAIQASRINTIDDKAEQAFEDSRIGIG